MILGRETRVDDNFAKQDRIQIDIGNWIYDGSDTSFRQFVNQISARSWFSIDGSEIELSPLTGVQRLGNNQYKIKFTSRLRGGVTRTGAPLLEGKLVFRKTGFNDHGPSRFYIKAEVSVNPTRAMVHQTVDRSLIDEYLGRPDVTDRRTTPDLRTRELPETVRNERAINPTDDNVIIDRPHIIMSGPTHWNLFRNRYFGQVVSLLEQLIGGTFRQNPEDGQLQLQLELNLKQVETYWEFHTPDPIHMMKIITPLFLALGTYANRREYENVSSDFLIDGNCPVLTTQLVTGLKAKLYPKTTNRLRLETTHNLQDRSVGIGGHTFSGNSALADVMLHVEELAADATREANLLLEIVLEALPPFPRSEPPYRLVAEIINSTTEATGRDFLLSAIINNGGYRKKPGDPLNAAITQLVKRGVLRRNRPYGPSFSLTGPYLHAQRILAAHDADNITTTE